MSLIINEEGTITIYQGDSGEITITGLDSDKNYVVYFAIQDENRKLIGQELSVSANKTDNVTFILTPEYTSLLTVPVKKPYQIYYYGVKTCEKNSSNTDTLFIANNTYGDLNRIIVYPRKVIGDANG